VWCLMVLLLLPALPSSSHSKVLSPELAQGQEPGQALGLAPVLVGPLPMASAWTAVGPLEAEQPTVAGRA
jgi:hypothetical protein